MPERCSYDQEAMEADHGKCKVTGLPLDLLQMNMESTVRPVV
jgi:hypothetical protein